MWGRSLCILCWKIRVVRKNISSKQFFSKGKGFPRTCLCGWTVYSTESCVLSLFLKRIDILRGGKKPTQHWDFGQKYPSLSVWTWDELLSNYSVLVGRNNFCRSLNYYIHCCHTVSFLSPSTFSGQSVSWCGFFHLWLHSLSEPNSSLTSPPIDTSVWSPFSLPTVSD